jgi:hypothetical protein
MMQRIRMPKGHEELSLGGVTYKPDETGAFEVPVEHAPELVRMHGGALEPSLEQLEAAIATAEADVQEAKKILSLRGATLQNAKATYSRTKDKLAADAEARAKAAAEEKKADGK